MLDSRINTFLLLCQTRSYTKTAQMLGITQPSVTQHIQYLQRHFGCQLFRYEGKTLILTPEGEYLRGQAKLMNLANERVTASLKRMSLQNAPLRIGIPKEFGDDFGAQLVAALLRQEGAQELSVHAAPSAMLIELTENGSLDCMIADRIYAEPVLDAQEIGELSFGCFGAAAMPPVITTDALLPNRLLVQIDASSDVNVMRLLLREVGLTTDAFAATWEIGSTAAIRQLVAEGQGISFAYRTAMLPLGDEIRQLGIREVSCNRTIVCLYRNDAATVTQTQALIAQIRQLWTACVEAVERK